MKRNVFFWIAAILGAAFGLLLFLGPPVASEAFGLARSPETDTLFRVLGATLLAVALLNFLVRNHPPSETLKAVLWTNIAAHGLGMIADLWAVGAGVLTFSGIAPGLVVHLFVGLGSLYYVLRMERT